MIVDEGVGVGVGVGVGSGSGGWWCGGMVVRREDGAEEDIVLSITTPSVEEVNRNPKNQSGRKHLRHRTKDLQKTPNIE
jgi:hypothetical protein